MTGSGTEEERLALSNALRPAVLGYLKTLSREVAASGVTVNSVLPGYTKTEVEHASMDEALHQVVQQHRILKRPETPDDLIGLVMFLSSPASAFITGQTIACCGGEVML